MPANRAWPPPRHLSQIIGQGRLIDGDGKRVSPMVEANRADEFALALVVNEAHFHRAGQNRIQFDRHEPRLTAGLFLGRRFGGEIGCRYSRSGTSPRERSRAPAGTVLMTVGRGRPEALGQPPQVDSSLWTTPA